MNSVILIGNLTRDPELNYTPGNQTAVCKFDIAVNRPKKNGEDQGADYPRITVWGRQAESCNQYLAKGKKVAVQGRLQTGSYTNRDGIVVYTTDVIADRVEFLSSPQGQNSAYETRNVQNGTNYQQGWNEAPQRQNFAPQQGYQNDMPSGFTSMDDDVPWG